jgi:hypothetical protein
MSHKSKVSIINQHLIAIANASRAAHIAALNAIEQLEHNGSPMPVIPVDNVNELSDTESESSVQFEINDDFIEFYKTSMEYKLLKSIYTLVE